MWVAVGGGVGVGGGCGCDCGEYFDVGCSRRVPWALRPRAGALLADLADPARSFDAIVVGEYERAFCGRQLMDLIPVLDRCGVGLWLPEVGSVVDFTDPVRRALVTMLGSQSKREVAWARFRVLAAMEAQVREQGRYLGGRPPYGYVLVDAGAHPNREHAGWGRRLRRLAVDPETAEWVRWIFARRLAGRSVAWIALMLNSTGVPCPSRVDRVRNRHRTGEGWTVQTVSSILGNLRYTGRQVWNRQGSVRDGDVPDVGWEWRGWNPPGEWVISREVVHEALVSEADFVAVQRMGPVAPPHRVVGRRYWLVGLVRCGVCGRRMESCWVHGRAGYRCRHGYSSGQVASPHRPANLYLREDVIVAQVAKRLGAEVCCESYLEACSAVVTVLRDRALMIVCTPEGCSVTDTPVHTTEGTTDGVQELPLSNGEVR